MTDKEKLIDFRLEYNDNGSFSHDDIQWLIQQAEKVERLEEEINTLREINEDYFKQVEQLEKSFVNEYEECSKMSWKIKRYEQALKEIVSEGKPNFKPTYVLIAEKALEKSDETN